MDVLLLMACSENDAPKVSELLDAGADVSVKVRLCQLDVMLLAQRAAFETPTASSSGECAGRRVEQCEACSPANCPWGCGICTCCDCN